jgi:DNA invertase Pin-like site-specific DNA recombinase
VQKQRKPKRWEQNKRLFQIPEPRVDQPVGLYPRQSTKNQKKNNRQSYLKQTQDAIDDLLKRGWPRELIIVYDGDMGTSAAKGIEEREAMLQMLVDIKDQKIRTVRASEVDRLFRDEDRIDSNLFIKVCKQADCLVQTDRGLYDFSIPRHVQYFRDEIDRAWEFYEMQILIRAHELAYRARGEGLFTGGAVNIGYILDKTRGSKTYKKIIPYHLHAPKVLELYQRVYDAGGGISFVCRELEKEPYVFPVEEDWVREQNLFHTNLERVLGLEKDEEGNFKPIGYKISAPGLEKLIKNRVYKGDWSFDGEWLVGNHEAIVPPDL